MKLTKLFWILLFSSLQLFANGGSIYTRYGLGDLRLSFSSRRFAMGGLGIAMNDQQYLSDVNPASWSGLVLSRVETSFLYNGDNLQTNSVSVYHSDVFFNGVMFGFPIQKDLGISLAFGLVPVSNVQYDTKEQVIDTLTDTHTNEYTGTGGISKFVLGTSYQFPLGISLGASFDYYFGRIENNSSITFVDNSTFSNASFQRQLNFHGIGFSAGLISNDFAEYIGIKNLKNLRLGLVYTSSVSLNTDSLEIYSTSVGTVDGTPRTYTTELPYKFGAGLTFNWTDDYVFVMDYLYQPFSKYTENGLPNQYLRDYTKYSFGFEYHDAETRSTSFWDYIALRAGFSYEQSQYFINNTGLNQVSVYGGFSFPLSYGNTIDIGLQYGVRGTTDNNLLKDNFFRINFSGSLGDIWFTRIER